MVGVRLSLHISSEELKLRQKEWHAHMNIHLLPANCHLLTRVQTQAQGSMTVWLMQYMTLPAMPAREIVHMWTCIHGFLRNQPGTSTACKLDGCLSTVP